MSEGVEIEKKDVVGVITLNRAATMNAVDAKLLAALGEAIDVHERDASVRAILLAAVGKHFCAGADFAFLEELTQTAAVDVTDRIYTHFQGAARRLYRSVKPTVAAVDGAAITVGCELALACDFRLVTSRTRFQESWIKLGLLPPLGGMFLLPRMVGLPLAKDMVLRGRAVGGEEAVKIGLAAELVAPAELAARALAFATELAALPPRAYALAKEGLQRGMESSIDREWAAGVLAQTLLIGGEDFKEGIRAVKEKRPGNFTGR